MAGTERGGNRVATVMLYLRAPDKGGATVFTELNLKVQPTPGAALIWWNIRGGLGGQGDYRTRHIILIMFADPIYLLNEPKFT